jgi:hypothetical protein
MRKEMKLNVGYKKGDKQYPVIIGLSTEETIDPLYSSPFERRLAILSVNSAFLLG